MDAPAPKVHLPLLAPPLESEESPGPAASASTASLSADQRRERRKRLVRGTTISIARLPKGELALGRLLYPEVLEDGSRDPPRPRTRAECAGAPRPCPFVSCKHHLYLDVSPKTGSIKLNFPDLEPDEMADSCALDVADRGGETLERVGEAMNVTRERVRQFEVAAIAKVKGAHSASSAEGLERLRELGGYEDALERVGEASAPPPAFEDDVPADLESAFDVETFLALSDSEIPPPNPGGE